MHASLLPFLSTLLTPILLILSFPNIELSILAWVALIPFFCLLDNTPKAKSFFLSYVAGLLFFGGTICWLTHVSKLGYGILILCLAFFFGIYGALANTFIDKFRKSKLAFLLFLVLPALWVALEYARGILFTGFPWCILGYTQYRNPVIIQIADITGAYGVSFIIIMGNFVLYAFLINIIRKKKYFPAVGFQAVASVIITAAVILYGYLELKREDFDTGLKLAVVQGNIEQEKKWDSAYEDYILTRYEILTREAAKEKPDIIIWPETAIPGYLDEEDIDLRLRNLIRDINTPLFLGAVTHESDGWQEHYYNSAVLFSLDGNVEKKYDKLHLVPFGEYVPFERYLPFFRDFIDVTIGDFTEGRECTLFEIRSKEGESLKYAALICFEDIFPALVRKFVQNGADFLMNVTNDAWFKESSEQLQHAQASVFRAVENRVSLLRAANTGFSCYINPKGVIEDSIYDENRGNIYISGFKTFNLKTSPKEPFYTKYGDIFAYLCIFLTILSLSPSRRRQR